MADSPAGRTRTYSKQNRPVTCCTECHRRKQKCDRKTPCNNCVSRAIDSRCSYQNARSSNDPVTRGNKSTARETPSPYYSSTSVLDSAAQSTGASKLTELIGYAGQSRSGLLAVLSQMLGEDEPASPTTGTAPNLIPAAKCSEVSRILAKLPPPYATQQLVRIFFNEANWYFAVLDQYYFDRAHLAWDQYRRNHNENDDASDLSWDMAYFAALLFQVIALALQFLPPSADHDMALGAEDHGVADQLSKRFSDAGEAAMDTLARQRPTIEAVQADLLRCAWLKNSGRGTEAWFSLGSALRQAQGLGLHLQPEREQNFQSDMTEMLSNLWYDEHKRRLWVTLFTWESHMALQLGRPRMINALDCTVTPPIDCDFPLDPARTLFTPTSIGDKPSSYTVQLVKYETAHIIHRFMSMGAANGRLKDYSVVQSLHNEVIELLNKLPPAMRTIDPDLSWEAKYPGLKKDRLQVAIIVHSILMALHRPHAVYHPSSRNAAITSALRVLQESENLFQVSEKHHYKIFTIMFYSVDAGLFLAAAAAKYPDVLFGEHGRSVLHALELTISRLHVLKERNSSAAFGEHVLEKCLKSLRKSVEDGIGVPDQHQQMMSGNVYVQNISTNVFGAPHDSPLENQQNTDAAELNIWGTSTSTESSNDGHIFDEVTNSRVQTFIWLEQIEMMSSNLEVQNNGYNWDTFLS